MYPPIRILRSTSISKFSCDISGTAGFNVFVTFDEKSHDILGLLCDQETIEGVEGNDSILMFAVLFTDFLISVVIAFFNLVLIYKNKS